MPDITDILPDWPSSPAVVVAGFGGSDDVDLAGPRRVRRDRARGAGTGRLGEVARDDAGLLAGGVRAGGGQRRGSLLPSLDQLAPALFPLRYLAAARLHVSDEHRQRG